MEEAVTHRDSLFFLSHKGSTGNSGMTKVCRDGYEPLKVKNWLYIMYIGF